MKNVAGSGGFFNKVFLTKNSLNCKNVNQAPPAYRSSEEEFYHVVKCQLLSKGVMRGGVVGALKNSLNVTN